MRVPRADMLKIGLIVGREWSFPPAFIEEVARRDEGVVAEYVKLGGTRMDDRVEYAVIIDRLSHEVPYYRTFLKHAALDGVTIVNNPFMWSFGLPVLMIITVSLQFSVPASQPSR